MDRGDQYRGYCISPDACLVVLVLQCYKEPPTSWHTQIFFFHIPTCGCFYDSSSCGKLSNQSETIYWCQQLSDLGHKRAKEGLGMKGKKDTTF